MARHLLQRMQTPKGKIGGLVTLGALALAGSAAIVNRQAAQGGEGKSATRVVRNQQRRSLALY